MRDRIFFQDKTILVEEKNKLLYLSGPFGTLEYDTDTGVAAVFKPGGGKPYLSGVRAEAQINGRKVQSADLKREGDFVRAVPLADSSGAGVKVTVRNAAPSFAILQHYYLYGGRPYFFLEIELESPLTAPPTAPLAAPLAAAPVPGASGIATNYMAPLVCRGGGADGFFPGVEGQDLRFLFVPFDNDEFVSYESRDLRQDSESYEVTAVFDNDSRRGFITGSVTHDVWKTGVGLTWGEGSFRVYGGVTSFQTRDVYNGRENESPQPHGEISGEVVRSPLIFLGFFDDWRDGLEEYGKANGVIAPPLAWNGGPPFGWNTWSAVADKVDYDVYVRASDFLKEHTPEFKNGVSPVYINFDSFWDRLSEEERKKAAAHVKANGQKPGIYHTPFTYWGSAENARNAHPDGVSGYTWYDILLKDKNGCLLPYMHGKGFPLDPTHPGAVAYNNYRFGKFLEWGFEYAKLDFMSHGAMEGAHYDPAVTTGIGAYNYGMKKILDFLGSRVTEQRFFLSLSIAPVFPSSYAHGRRISCDIFGEINCAEYMLNSLTYGWWLNNAVYPWNDPDHIVVYTSFNRPAEKGPILFNEGLTRYVSSAIAGTFMIDSDDVRVPAARERLKAILNNPEINAIAASGRSFRPVEGNTGSRAACVFVRDDRALGGDFYLAAFNYSAENSVIVTVGLERAGAGPGKTWRMKNLLDHTERRVSGTVEIELEPAEPKLFRLF
ncbi:MAG: hypothetical protein LBG76_05265 [Treponema sp.]|nr:hypothetical protein [Treponema sp.]